MWGCKVYFCLNLADEFKTSSTERVKALTAAFFDLKTQADEFETFRERDYDYFTGTFVKGADFLEYIKKHKQSLGTVSIPLTEANPNKIEDLNDILNELGFECTDENEEDRTFALKE